MLRHHRPRLPLHPLRWHWILPHQRPLPALPSHDRIHGLLADGHGDIPTSLTSFAHALCQADSPAGVLQWLRPRQPAAALLRQIATAGQPVSHELLDSYPQP
jgi:hypothetical protein